MANQKNNMFTEEQKQNARAIVEDRVAKKRQVQAVTNAKGKYEQAQASYYIDDLKKDALKKHAEQMKAAGNENWQYADKVKADAEKNNYDYTSALSLEDKLKKGELDDAVVLRFAGQRVKKLQDKEDAQNRATVRRTVAMEIYQNLEPETHEAMGLTGNQIQDLALIEHELFGTEYVQMGPSGVITTNESLLSKLKQGSFGAAAKIPEGYEAGFLEEYGNNYFKLFTFYPGFKNFMVADGVMTELPPISMSTEWGNSPAASIGEELDKALNNEFLEFCAMKTTDAKTPIMRRKDALTARSYVDSGDVSFQIKFRCYPGQQVGTKKLTTAKEWMLLLSMTTPINAACSFNVNNAIGTVVKAADGIAEAFKALKDAVFNGGNKEANTKENANANAAEQRAEYILEGQEMALASFSNVDARLSNPNVFGACLFGVRIYPFIFKAPLTCYISSWSVTPSREWNETVKDHYYYDFVLNCAMDQKPSAMTWWTKILLAI